MSKNVNINRNVNDPYYRYKMPRIMAKVEGKGNGIKTVIANMSEIGKALARPPTYPTKYFGCELGAQTNFDLKNERYIVNGEHDANKLQDILDGFIKKFVLCPACDNPETVLNVKRNTIYSKCKACGHSFLIDPKHKLSTFILKNPPQLEANDADAKERRGDSGSPTSGLAENGVSDDVADGMPAENIVVVNGVVASTAPLLADDDEDWAPEPLDNGGEKLSAQIGKLVLDKDLDKTTEERLDMLHQYFINAKKSGAISDGKAMLNEAERLELKTKATLLLADVIFDADIVKQIAANRNLLLRFCHEDKKAQRHLLGGIEQVIHQHKDALLPKAAHIIKALYDNDICDEETLLAWGEKPSGKYVKKDFAGEIIKVAEKVLDWLRNAEEETESENDEEVAVNFDDRSRVIGTVDEAKPKAHETPAGKQSNGVFAGKQPATTESAAAAICDENGDELDIDDI